MLTFFVAKNKYASGFEYKSYYFFIIILKRFKKYIYNRLVERQSKSYTDKSDILTYNSYSYVFFFNSTSDVGVWKINV